MTCVAQRKGVDGSLLVSCWGRVVQFTPDTCPFSHWAAQYIGIPYQIGGADRSGIDCFGLLRLVYAETFGIVLPELKNVVAGGFRLIAGHIEAASQTDWVEVPTPFDGCAVGMSQKSHLHHVGIYAEADGGRIIHAWSGKSVVADDVKSIARKGFRVVKFYRHRLWPTSSIRPICSSP